MLCPTWSNSMECNLTISSLLPFLVDGLLSRCLSSPVPPGSSGWPGCPLRQGGPLHSCKVYLSHYWRVFSLTTCKTFLHPPMSFCLRSTYSICLQTVSNRQSNYSCRCDSSLLQALLKNWVPTTHNVLWTRVVLISWSDHVLTEVWSEHDSWIVRRIICCVVKHQLTSWRKLLSNVKWETQTLWCFVIQLVSVAIHQDE